MNVLVTLRNGELWRSHVLPDGTLCDFSEVEMAEVRRQEREFIERIAAEVLNREFSRRGDLPRA